MHQLEGNRIKKFSNIYRRGEEVFNVAPWEQLNMVETITTFDAPTVWVRHFNFLDFESLGFASPSWINIVRDPVCNKRELLSRKMWP